MVNNMKVALSFLMLALVLASPNLQQQVGESCRKDPNFVIQVFDVNPWPLVRIQNYVINIGGVFIEKDYVEQLYIGLKDGKGFWHYTYQSVNKEFAKNAVGNFTVNLQAPSDKGSYTSQVSVHRSSLDELACWQYYYVI
jgi:hypothetical protein